MEVSWESRQAKQNERQAHGEGQRGLIKIITFIYKSDKFFVIHKHL